MRRRKRSYVIKDPDAEQRARLWRAWLVQMGLFQCGYYGHLIKNDGTPPKPAPLDFCPDLTHQGMGGGTWYSTDANGIAQAQYADDAWRNWRYLIRIENESVEVYDTHNCCPQYLKDCLTGERKPHCSVQEQIIESDYPATTIPLPF